MSLRKSIMLIDDNPSSNLYHKIMIEDAGLALNEVSDFVSSEHALKHLSDLFSSKSFDAFPKVIIIDINMPNKNGWECVDKIMSWNLGAYNPRIYMVSNSRHPRDIERAEQHPLINELLEKFVDAKFFASLFD